MEALAARQRIVPVLGVLLAFPLSCFGDLIRTYGGRYDLRIPAGTVDSRGWMDDAVIDVPDHLAICDVDVRISLTHTKAFDLRIFLQSPAGRRICLNTYNPFTEYFEGENYTQTVFDDEAEIPINQVKPPFTGRFRPREPYRLAAFDGEDCFGPWRLQIYDAYYMDTGSLNSFELIITRPIVPPTVATLAAANVQGNNATLRGLIKDDGGKPCQYRFSYWTWGYYACTGWSDDGDSKTIGQGFYREVADLGRGTYHFSAQAKNSAGEGNWADAQAFTVRGSTVRRFTGSGSGTKNDPYIIRNVYELQQIDRDLAACYELANDIDASDTNNWNSGYGFTPLGRYTAPFEGVFDGKGHVITGLCANRTFLLCVGLFGCTGKTSEIRNVGLNNVTATGYACVGGLTGFNGGVIEACYVSGNVSGDTQVGGLVGTNYGWITNCYSTAGVSGGDPCESGDFIAGLVGRSPDGILNNCFSTGRVTGKDCQGLVGICGGECIGCFWDIETSGQATSACGIGKRTAEMQTWATFDAAGWSGPVSSVEDRNGGGWIICEGMDYPKLAWQIRPGDEFCPGGVDMVDFAVFAARWKAGKPNSSGDGSDTADFNQSGAVNATDLEILTSSWLAGGK